jgi:hypothetical protein
MPRQLRQDVQSNEIALKANTDLLEAKRRETTTINAKYEEDKRRYAELVKTGAATPAAPVASAPAQKR